MQGGDGAQDGRICCEACGTAVPSYDVVSYGSLEQGYRALCNCCFNAEIASALGLENFENILLRPVVMTDCAGEKHEFHFRMRLLGSMTALDAFDGRLIERMRRSLAVKYLVSSDFGAQIADFAAATPSTAAVSGRSRVRLLGDQPTRGLLIAATKRHTV